MRKLFILITFICSLMMSSVAHAEWTKVSVTKSHLSYVDLDSIRKYDGRVHYWSLRNFHKPQKTGFTSAQIYIEAECGRFRFRFLNVVTFEGPFASGKVLLANDIPEKNGHGWIRRHTFTML